MQPEQLKQILKKYHTDRGRPYIRVYQRTPNPGTENKSLHRDLESYHDPCIIHDVFMSNSLTDWEGSEEKRTTPPLPIGKGRRRTGRNYMS